MTGFECRHALCGDLQDGLKLIMSVNSGTPHELARQDSRCVSQGKIGLNFGKYDQHILVEIGIHNIAGKLIKKVVLSPCRYFLQMLDHFMGITVGVRMSHEIIAIYIYIYIYI